jgi:hypothetical protein
MNREIQSGGWRVTARACCIILVLIVGAFTVAQAGVKVVKGTVTDLDTHKPIAAATVQLLGSGRATLTNDRGEYRLLLGEDTGQLKFSHVAYYSERVERPFGDSISYVDIALHSATIELPGQVVSARNYDAAQRIILEAIKRKQDILSRLHDYRFEAYTKLSVRDLSKPDSTNIFLLTETQISCFWEQPGKYKEVIRARKQSANLPPEANLVTVGEILNFNKNRISLGDYQIATPTAEDALDSYNYYLVDTVMLDSRRVFVLEVEPKSQVVPLFEGKIEIADSTFDVVAVDVGFNKAVRLTFLQNLRYSQRFAQFNNEYWMPVEIRFGAKVKFPVPFPGVPAQLSFLHVASLHDFSFEKGTPKGVFDEYALQVDLKADDNDSIRWNAEQMIPLTAEETQAYHRIDSIEKAPKPIGKTLLKTAAAIPLIAIVAKDFFHFNRVEGAYLGLGGTNSKALPQTDLRFKSGYAFSYKHWEHNYGIMHEFWHPRRLWAGVSYSDEIVTRPTIFVPWGGNPTMGALGWREDPFDYYHQRGFSINVHGRVLPFTTLRLGYHDYSQYSMDATTDYSFFGDKDEVIDHPAIINGDTSRVRYNPTIINGKMRSVTASLTYDSRRLIDNKGKDRTMGEPSYLITTAQIEYASPRFISNNFDFRRYALSVTARRPILGLGASKVAVIVGQSDGALPPQKYFTVPFGSSVFDFEQGFQSLEKVNFGGSKVASVTWRHEFERLLWGKSGIPLVKKIPWTLDIFGGAFWTDFQNHALVPGDSLIRTARSAYSEIGFSIGNLTPFIAPFNLSVGFTWQLSTYDTRRFTTLIGFRL